MILRRRRGMVLVFALWVLSILTILAVSVAAGIRQKIFLVQRLDERSRMNDVMQAAVKKSAAYIHEQMEFTSFQYTNEVKVALFHPDPLSQIQVGTDEAQVSIVDEESKINLNTTNPLILKNLFVRVLGLKDDAAQSLSLALLDWRQYGESQTQGFFSDEYYSNLQYPYPKKNADYESIDEMLLVKGVDKKMYEQLLNVVTVYGPGTVNINTASEDVLVALGLDEQLAEKILAVRRGKDGIDGTADDHVFLRTFDVAADVNAITPLESSEIHAIDGLNAQGLLAVNSFYFTVAVDARVGRDHKKMQAVYACHEDKIAYWNER